MWGRLKQIAAVGKKADDGLSDEAMHEAIDSSDGVDGAIGLLPLVKGPQREVVLDVALKRAEGEVLMDHDATVPIVQQETVNQLLILLSSGEGTAEGLEIQQAAQILCALCETKANSVRCASGAGPGTAVQSLILNSLPDADLLLRLVDRETFWVRYYGLQLLKPMIRFDPENTFLHLLQRASGLEKLSGLLEDVSHDGIVQREALAVLMELTKRSYSSASDDAESVRNLLAFDNIFEKLLSIGKGCGGAAASGPQLDVVQDCLSLTLWLLQGSAKLVDLFVKMGIPTQLSPFLLPPTDGGHLVPEAQQVVELALRVLLSTLADSNPKEDKPQRQDLSQYRVLLSNRIVPQVTSLLLLWNAAAPAWSLALPLKVLSFASFGCQPALESLRTVTTMSFLVEALILHRADEAGVIAYCLISNAVGSCKSTPDHIERGALVAATILSKEILSLLGQQRSPKSPRPVKQLTTDESELAMADLLRCVLGALAVTTETKTLVRETLHQLCDCEAQTADFLRLHLLWWWTSRVNGDPWRALWEHKAQEELLRFLPKPNPSTLSLLQVGIIAILLKGSSKADSAASDSNARSDPLLEAVDTLLTDSGRQSWNELNWLSVLRHLGTEDLRQSLAVTAQQTPSFGHSLSLQCSVSQEEDLLDKETMQLLDFLIETVVLPYAARKSAELSLHKSNELYDLGKEWTAKSELNHQQMTERLDILQRQLLDEQKARGRLEEDVATLCREVILLRRQQKVLLSVLPTVAEQ
jgi:hypothetical protein